MTKSEYIQAIREVLGFMKENAKVEVLADMDELYDGLAGRGMGDREVQERIGTPAQVAREYRLAEQLHRVERSPGAAAGARIGLLTLTGKLIRGAAFRLLGLVWLALALVVITAAVAIVAGLAAAVLEATGFEPLVTTLAVPGIPIISGVLMGLAIAAASTALLLGTRAVMRALVRAMRSRLAASRKTGAQGVGAQDAGADSDDAGQRWIDSRRAVWQSAAVALLLAIASAVTMPSVAAPEFPLSVNRSVEIDLDGVSGLQIAATRVEVVLSAAGSGELGKATATLSAEVRRTFGQAFDLAAETRAGEAILTAYHRGGLSWGINPYPTLLVTLPPGFSVPITVRVQDATVDDSALPPEARASVRVEGDR